MITARTAKLICLAYYLASFFYVYIMETQVLFLNKIEWTELKLYDQVMILGPMFALQICGLVALYSYYVEAQLRQCSPYAGTKFSGI